MSQKINIQKGFIPLLIAIIISIVAVSTVTTGVVLHKQGKLSPLVASIAQVFERTEDAESEVKFEEPQPERKQDIINEEEQASEEKKPEFQTLLEVATQLDSQTSTEPQSTPQPEPEPEMEPEPEAEPETEEEDKTELEPEPAEPIIEEKPSPETKLEPEFEVDTIAPIILDITVSNITTNSADISWQTNEITKYLTDWKESILGSKSSAEWSKSHWVKLINLQANTTYHFTIIVQDKTGHETIAERKKFTTLDNSKPVEIPKPVVPKFKPIKIPNVCVNCLGIDISCGCSNCTDCNKLDGWVNVGKPYHSDLGPGGFYFNQKQEYRDYFCSGTFCEYRVTKTQTKRMWIKDSSFPFYPGIGLPKDFGEIHPFDPGVRIDPGPIIPFK